MTQSLRMPLNVLTILAVLYTVHVARDVLLPITLALIVTLLLSPVVQYLEQLRIPRSVSAVLLIVSLLAVIVGGLYALSEPTMKWLARAPEAVQLFSPHIEEVQGQIKEVDQATKSLESLTESDQEENAAAGQAEIQVKQPGWRTDLWIASRNLVTYTGLSIILLFFLLSSGEALLRRIINTLPNDETQKRMWAAAVQAQGQMSQYLTTIIMINAAVGAVTAAALWAAGFPDPWLWGVIAAVLRFVPYLGVSFTITLIGIVALVTYSDPIIAASFPLSYFLFASFVGQILDPHFHGYRLNLNPIIVFLWIFFWGWLWGAPGVLLALPLLTLFHLFCRYHQGLQGLAQVIGPFEPSTLNSGEKAP